MAAVTSAPSAPADAPAHAATARPLLRAHWPFATLLAVGVVLRVLALADYRPALLYIDSYSYLEDVVELYPAGSRPIGYSFFLRGLLPLGGWHIEIIPIVQHLMGLALAVGLYALLLRAGARRWVATLAAAPVLLDAYQIQIEQNVLAETLFVTLVTVGLVLLVDGAGRDRPGLGRRLATAAVAGLLLGVAVPVRLIGQFIVVPGVVYLLFERGRRWSHRGLAAAAFALVFATPVLGYMAYYASFTGDFTTTAVGGRMMYGRVAVLVDCGRTAVPDDLATLCPDEPLGQRAKIDNYVWNGESPLNRLDPPRGLSQDQALREFAMLVVRQQPLDVVGAVAVDMLKMYWPTKAQFAGDVDVGRWHFKTVLPDYGGARVIEAWDIDRRIAVGPAQLLRTYQLRVGWTPGPLLAVAVAVAVAAGLGLGAARRSPLRGPALLWAASAVVLAMLPAVYEFSWRYMLPALVLMPVAGALGVTALTDRTRQ